MAVPAPDTAEAAANGQHSGAVGSRVPKMDSTEIVTGRAVYADDIQLPGMLHARILRSPHAHAHLLGIDTKPAHTFSENDRYLMSMLSDFGAVALSNCGHIGELKDRIASAAERPDPTTQEEAVEGLISDLTESIVEAERISRELRNLAAAAQILAAKLQVVSRSG